MSADWADKQLPLAERIELLLAWAPTQSGFALGRELYADNPVALANLAAVEALVDKLREAAAALADTQAEVARRQQALVKTLQ